MDPAGLPLCRLEKVNRVERITHHQKKQALSVHSRGIGSRQASLSSVNGSTTSVKDIRITENPLQNPTV